MLDPSASARSKAVEQKRRKTQGALGGEGGGTGKTRGAGPGLGPLSALDV